MLKDKSYLSQYGVIQQLNKKLIELLDNLSGEEFEERLIYKALYSLDEKLEDAAYTMSYCSRATKEGYLKASPYTEGRYVLGKHEFSCGAPVEIFLWGKWIKGSVEMSITS